jgi:hypothetical protein
MSIDKEFPVYEIVYWNEKLMQDKSKNYDV